MEVKGVGDAIGNDLKLVFEAGLTLASGNIKARTLLDAWSRVLEYYRTSMALEEREISCVLFLDKKNQLIKDGIQQTGTVDHTLVYPREVAKRALELSATAIILVHNHPSGDSTASGANFTMTRSITSLSAVTRTQASRDCNWLRIITPWRNRGKCARKGSFRRKPARSATAPSHGAGNGQTTGKTSSIVRKDAGETQSLAFSFKHLIRSR
jgi:hypothetical protein